jgi:hypothetical protein
MAPSAGNRGRCCETGSPAVPPRRRRLVGGWSGAAKVVGSWDVPGESAPADGRRARVAHRSGDDASGQPGGRNDLRRLPGPPARRALAAARRVGPTGPLRGGHLDQLRRQRRHAQPACAPRGSGRAGASASPDHHPASGVTAGRDTGRPRLCPAPPGAGHQLRLRTAGEPPPRAGTDDGRGRHVPAAPEGRAAPTRSITTTSSTATPPHPAAATSASAPHPSHSDPGAALRTSSEASASSRRFPSPPHWPR